MNVLIGYVNFNKCMEEEEEEGMMTCIQRERERKGRRKRAKRAKRALESATSGKRQIRR